MEELRLKRNEEHRILKGHPWIFSNEIVQFPKGIPPGDLVEICRFDGCFLGRGYFNPRSLIAVRLLTRSKETIDRDFFRQRIHHAAKLRSKLFPGENCFRLIFSEADGLPGLIVDRYGEFLLMQSLTAGMENLSDMILLLLKEIFDPKAIVLRNDSPIRDLEGLPLEKKIIFGKIDGPIQVVRDGMTFEVDLLEGQKTGLFLDQFENYRVLKGLVSGATVLDGFCYGGGWALWAARLGALSVIGVDRSEWAIRSALRNASLNGLESQCEFIQADVLGFLKEKKNGMSNFECIILDPPAFVKRKNKIMEGMKGYLDLNRKAMGRLNPGGFLITSSCSHHVSLDLFQEIIQKAANQAKKNLRLLEARGQSRDHPSLPAAKETTYLKCLIFQVD